LCFELGVKKWLGLRKRRFNFELWGNVELGLKMARVRKLGVNF